MAHDNIINSSEFLIQLLIFCKDIYVRHMAEMKRDNYQGVPFNDRGTEGEKEVKELFTKVALLISNDEELYYIIEYLKVDIKKLPILYGESIDPEKYLSYHYDTFIIRLATTLDLCGKIGIKLFGINQPERSANANTFINSNNQSANSSKTKLSELRSYLEVQSRKRHAKVHTGESIDNRFDEVIYWQHMGKIIKSDELINNELLGKHTQTQIDEGIAELEKILIEKNRLVLAFLDSLLPQLNNFITQNIRTA